jgi:hypothetical protein
MIQENTYNNQDGLSLPISLCAKLKATLLKGDKHSATKDLINWVSFKFVSHSSDSFNVYRIAVVFPRTPFSLLCNLESELPNVIFCLIVSGTDEPSLKIPNSFSNATILASLARNFLLVAYKR